MAIHDSTSQRLYVAHDLQSGGVVLATAAQFNYLVRVMRLVSGDEIRVFNGCNGEWLATLDAVSKRSCNLVVREQTRLQVDGPDINYLFAPLKRARLDYMVQKAVELGVRRLSPVLTRHTIAERVNGERMLANAIEAAEQCGVLQIPTIDQPLILERALAHWQPERCLIFCDEAASVADPIVALLPLRGRPVAVLIGPEGGFDPQERELLRGQSFSCAISLGPRIMRADTAAVAALALVNAVIGDWR